jgi:hypothetical protein
MEALFDTTSLSKLFVPTVPLIEAFLRGTIVYLALFAMFRFLAQRGSRALRLRTFWYSCSLLPRSRMP